MLETTQQTLEEWPDDDGEGTEVGLYTFCCNAV